MRYLKYIFLVFFISILTVSCIEEIESPNVQESDVLTLVPRVTNFANQYVTKSSYSTNETKITSLAVLAFNEDNDLILIHEDSNDSGITSVALSKSMLNFNDPVIVEKLDAATLVVFANIGINQIIDANGKSLKDIKDNKETLKLSAIDGFTCHFSDSQTVVTDLEDDNFKGFPMVGRSSNVNLTMSSSQQGVEVGLEILYAKVKFIISVAEGTENAGTGVSFKLNSYSVHNVSKATPLTKPTGATVSDSYAYTTASNSTDNSATVDKTTNLDGPSFDFTFYVSESRYALAEGVDLSGIYPDNSWMNPSSPNANQRQYYKPRIVEQKSGLPGNGLATYALLNGIYKDYRGQEWTVNYQVYLGKDNHSNFEVDRNSEYTNHITIKGIRNNDSFENGSLWIDHRVDVSYTEDPVKNIGITRETLIDSHFEVRPLRVKWNEGEYTHARIYLPTSNGSVVNWIGIERFTGDNCQDISLYCHDGETSFGKRRYFTTNLISELHSITGEFGIQTTSDGKKYINLNSGDCAWIYIDENTSTSASERTAEIILEFITDEDVYTEVYNIKQRGLTTVGGYIIESYEEYLHSYDSEDKYNLSTSPIDYTQQGLEWGFPNTQLSKDMLVSAVSLPSWAVQALALDFTNAVYQRYDYIHPSDGDYTSYTKKSGSWAISSESANGKTFTSRATENKLITIVDMATMPDNAYQYCLSKNKFNEDADGKHTLDIHWYLPDAYELQSILNAAKTNNTSADLNTDSYYWSSQPSYSSVMPNLLDGIDLLLENSSDSRAVSGNEISNISRSEKNRIRCVYSAEAIHVDMSERAPDGVGGNYYFYMKAYNSGNQAFFYNTLNQNAKTAYTESGTDDYKKKNAKYSYPTFNSPGSNNPFEFSAQLQNSEEKTFSGFLKNPTSSDNWQYDGDGYSAILAEFEGLSEFELEEKTSWGSGQGVYKPTNIYREDVKVDSTLHKNKLEKVVSATTSSSLNLLLNIQFSNNTNNTNYPVYYYNEYDNRYTNIKTTSTKRWKVKYQEVPYTPKGLKDEYTHEVKNISKNRSSIILNKDMQAEEVRNEAKSAAIEQAMTEAKKKYPNRLSYYIKEGTDNISVSGKWTNTLRTKYQATATGTITIVCESKAEPSVYYANASDDSGWYVYKEEPKYLTGIINDELRLYSGNSFTVSLNDEYRDDYEIVKVKVYYSGDTYIREKTVESGLIDDTYTYYARFVESTVTFPHTQQNITGMTYSDDNNGGTHQWKGEGKQNVTLVLADYIQKKATISTSYEYNIASENLGKYLVVDRIEVQCKRKAESASN